MSESKKRKNDAGDQARNKQTVYVVQSIFRNDSHNDREYKTHNVYSTVNAANEAARRIFNKLGDNLGDLGSVTEAGWQRVHVIRLRTGRLIHNHDDNDEFR
jgi:hypothetical protein